MKQIAKTLISAFALLFATHASAKTDYEDPRLLIAYEHYQKQEYLQAKSVWEALRNDGDLDAIVNIAFLYTKGLGVDKNDAITFKLMQEAAKKGSIAGIFNLAIAYKDGIGTVIDYQKALELFHSAANHGELGAYHNLGFMHQHGLGVPANMKKAKDLYLIAANQGYAISQNDVAYLYTDPQSGFADNKEALRWYKEAAKQQFPEALDALGTAHIIGFAGTTKDPLIAYAYFYLAGLAGIEESKKAADEIRQKLKIGQYSIANTYIEQIAKGKLSGY